MPCCDPKEQPEVTTRIRADRKDIHVLVLTGSRTKGIGVHTERNEDDSRRAGTEPFAQPRGLTLGVRDDRARVAERANVQLPHAFTAKLQEPLRQPDRRIHDRCPDETRSLQQDQGNPNRVDG